MQLRNRQSPRVNRSAARWPKRFAKSTTSRDLKRVAEDVLPQIEKFLESPEEKRLRRMRSGVITAACGIGATVMALLGLSVIQFLKDPDALPMLMFFMGLGIVTFMIGLGLVINGRLLTQPRKELKDSSSDAQAQNLLDAGYAAPQLRPAAEKPELFRSATTSDLAEAERRAAPSVTEHTTHHLKTDR